MIEQDSYAKRLSQLYPYAVQLGTTPLPSQWHVNTKDPNLMLTNNNLRVHYVGMSGKSEKDGGSVRADAPILPACGAFYFEVLIVHKSLEGFMSIGLNRGVAFKNNRLPGGDRDSFGYYGDDGDPDDPETDANVPYGPAFSTGDTVGCGVDFVEGNIFFTKNGVFLGAPFENLKLTASLYPVVGLQRPGEIVEANFGQNEFDFDFSGYLKRLREKVKVGVENQPTSNLHGEWQAAVDRLVCGYLEFHGYAQAAEAFSRACRAPLSEPLANIQARQRLEALVLQGELDKAEAMAEELSPGILQRFPALRFAIRRQQFIELVKTTDLQTCLPPKILKKCSQSGIEENSSVKRIFQLGHELRSLQSELKLDGQLYASAVSLLAYSNPSESPLRDLLDPCQREPVAAALNSALVGGCGSVSVLERVMTHTTLCLGALTVRTSYGGPTFLYDLFKKS